MLYLLRKLSYLFCSLFVVATLTFFLMKMIPGDPFNDEQGLPADIQISLKRHYGLDQPWYVQYGTYLQSLAKFDLGPSFKYSGRSVNSIIAESFPVSALLGLEAFILAVALGISIGTWAALKKQSWQTYVFFISTTLAISVPSFILAALLQYGFAIKLHLLPLARCGSFSHTILPVLALAALPAAFIARLTRSSVYEVLQQDYIKTAKAKGLSLSACLLRHALPNALLPVLTYLGPLLANILTGSFIIEKIFSIPGLGQWFVQSVSNRDYTVIMGLTLFYSIILMMAVWLVDIIYSWLDPRIQIKGNRK